MKIFAFAFTLATLVFCVLIVHDYSKQTGILEPTIRNARYLSPKVPCSQSYRHLLQRGTLSNLESDLKPTSQILPKMKSAYHKERVNKQGLLQLLYMSYTLSALTFSSCFNCGNEGKTCPISCKDNDNKQKSWPSFS